MRACSRSLLLVAVGLLPGCLTVNMTRIADQREPDPEGLTALVEGESDLTACLSALGAPLKVKELEDGAVLGWGWSKSRFFSANLSVPVTDFYSGSLQVDRAGEKLEGLVLFFDETWTLQRIQRGQLRDLLNTARARPVLVE